MSKKEKPDITLLVSQYDSSFSGKLKNANEIINMDIAKIDTNPNQPRKTFDEKALKELAASIQNHGVIQPIIVAENGNRFSIVAGERRYRASKIANKTSIPVIVTSLSDNQQKEIMIIENLQREDLNPIEEAQGIQSLMKECNLTQDLLARRLGKSRPAITNALRLLTLPEYILDYVKQNKISAGHARALVSIKEYGKTLEKLVNNVIEKRLSVRQLELEVNTLIAKKKNPTQKRRKKLSTDLRNFVDTMQRQFGTKVKIIGNESKGRIYIDYFTQDDLDRIYDIIIGHNNDVENEEVL